MSRNYSPKKIKNIKYTLLSLFHYLRNYRLAILLSIILAIIAAVLGVVGPKVLGDITNIAKDSLELTGEIAWQPIRQKIDFLVVVYLTSSILSYTENVIMGKMTARFTRELRLRILDKINRLPISYFDKNQYGDVLSRMSNDVDTIAAGLSEQLTETITNIITIIGIFVMMLTISIPLSMIALFTVPISTIFVSKITKKAQKIFIASRETLGELNNHIEEDYSGHLIIKSCSHESESEESFSVVNEKLYEESWKSSFLSRVSYPVVHVITNLGYTAVCIMGGILALEGTINVGNIQAFIQYTMQFNRPISDMADSLSNIQLTLAASERVFEFLAEKEEREDSTKPQVVENVKGAVSFHDVSFSYTGDKPTIKDFNIDIAPGSKVAIVGPTGAGKTTIINLLMRFYDPDKGYITIDGVPTTEMRRADVRKLFGMVLQDTWLFSGTVAENLKYGSENASDEEMYFAAQNANIHHFIKSLDKGYDSVISEDSDNVSAGEKQLLTIARALVANPPMIILDEATSNVDTRTEQLIEDAFEKLTKNRTSFVIAHRLSTIRNSDLILVMRDGAIVEQGNHDSLLKQKGFYAELYNSQFNE